MVSVARPRAAVPLGRGAASLLALAVVVAAAPDPVPLAGARLWALAATVAGVGVLTARVRAVDLAAGPIVGVAAVAGGVLPAVAGLAPWLGLPVGAAAGALAGGAVAAVLGRAGRQLGALASLAVGVAVVAVLGAVEIAGGVVGFHAVGLPTGAGDRADALLVGAVATLVLVTAAALGRTRLAAAAATGAADPAVAASLGRWPTRDLARIGAAGGACAGTGGTLLALVDGSVVPGAYGLELTATLLVAAALGGAALLGPIVGTLLAWGPATLWPLTPLGALPVLLTAGPLALVVLALRRGRPLLPHGEPRGTDARPGTSTPDQVDRDAAAPPAPAAPDVAAAPVLRLDATPTPSGPVDLAVRPGEVVAIAGANGAGKSTLLARVGGQLPDHGSVTVAGVPAPRGPTRRARAGVARTWQRRVDVTARDLDRVVGHPGGRDDLDRLVASRPRVALLDEPTDHAPDRVAAAVAALRRDGTAVLLVDHRPEVRAVADRVVTLGGDPVAGPGGGR